MKLESVNIRFVYCLLASALITGMYSCNNKPADPNNPEAVAEQHNDAKFHNDKRDDADFMVDIAVLNMEEIQLGKLAQSQGMSKDVKALGKKMEEAHSKSLEEIKKLAKNKSVTIPDALKEDSDNDYTSLKTKEGNEFDKSFCQVMTDKHKKAIEKCEKASSDAVDIDVKNWANKTLPELRAHLDETMNCGEKYSQSGN